MFKKSNVFQVASSLGADRIINRIIDKSADRSSAENSNGDCNSAFNVRGNYTRLWKKFCVVLALLLLINFSLLSLPFAIFASENEGSESSSTVAESSESTSTLAETNENSAELFTTPGTIKVGMEANYSPFNWTQTSDKNGAVPIANSPGEFANGYDVWMAKKIADSLGLKLEIQKIEWDGLTPALMSGVVDVIIAGMSPTAERKEQIDFSDAYYTSDLVLVVRKESEYAKAKSLADFAGAKVTGQLNTLHYRVIDQIEGVNKQEALDSFPTMIAALRSQTIDAYVSERPGAMSAASANKDLTYVVFDEDKGFKVNPEDIVISIGVRKGSGLDEKLNPILASISTDERQNAMQQMIKLEDAGDEEQKQSFLASMSDIIKEYWSLFARGAAMTMLVSIFGTVIGFLIGLIVQILREIPIKRRNSKVKNVLIKLLHIILNIYIEIFRGTPMMVQAVLIFYGSRFFFNLEMSPLVAGFIIVSINTGAYLAEVIRGGIRSVDRAQHEACQALGLTHSQSMRYVILPQTIKAILPSVGNEFVVNIKDTSVLNVISVTELFFATRSVAGSTFLIFQTYVITALIYFVLTFTTTRIINYLGKKRGNKQFSLSSSTGGIE